MPKATDQSYLLADQYNDAKNLTTRLALHQRFSTNSRGWMPWLFDQLLLLPQLDEAAPCRILELGTGPGDLWRLNGERIPAAWNVTLSDFSPGMLEETRSNLRETPHEFTFARVDAQQIPYPDATFDFVIANHMLYHVPDRPQALREIRRVLKPSGRLFASTASERNMHELGELLCRFDASLPYWGGRTMEIFSLENGEEQLRPFFSPIELRRYPDGLVITETEPLVAYVCSMMTDAVPEGDQIERFRAFVQRELDEKSAIGVSKDAGVFIAARWEA